MINDLAMYAVLLFVDVKMPLHILPEMIYYPVFFQLPDLASLSPASGCRFVCQGCRAKQQVINDQICCKNEPCDSIALESVSKLQT